MSKERWTEVEEYLVGTLVGADPVLEAALATSRAAGLPAISVSPTEGKLLHLLARTRAAHRILEIGTLGGYSAIWLGRALPPGGRLVSLEIEPRHAEVARANLARAGLGDLAEVRVGRALDSLARLREEGLAPFDLVFIDADKTSYPDYFAAALSLSGPGSLIVADNVVRDGEVADPASQDASVQGVRAMLAGIASTPSVSATAIQTVGEKGYDGFALALVTGTP